MDCLCWFKFSLLTPLDRNSLALFFASNSIWVKKFVSLFLSVFEISTRTSIADVEIVENNNDDLIFWICSDLVNSIIIKFGSDCSSSSSSLCSNISSVLDLMTVRNISVIPSITSVATEVSME